ncbi:MAG: hypothetical protein U9Q15_02190 [Patescibacteria group bacterium]|nr:hypothetical protein [Patescibacteria group bacterium]
MKKFLSLIVLAPMISACSLFPEIEKVAGENTISSSDREFSITLNENFILISQDDLSPGTVLAAADLTHEKNAITPNINIVKTQLGQTFPNYVFAKANIKKAKEALSDYEEIDQEDITIDGYETILHTFTSGDLYYIQSYILHENTSYTVTITSYQDIDENLLDEYIKIIKTLSFTKEKEQE